MKALLLYETEEKMISSDRFLSKQKLREVFGNNKIVSLTFTYTRNRYRLDHSKGRPSIVKKNYPVYKQKTRTFEI